jgi:hypothetical protein
LVREHRGPFLMANVERREIKRKGKLSRSSSPNCDLSVRVHLGNLHLLYCAVIGLASRSSSPNCDLGAETAVSRYICVRSATLGDACKARNVP